MTEAFRYTPDLKERESNSKIALIFPGQGSQKVGMGLDLYNSSPVAKATFDEANDVLGMNLAKLCFEGPEESLRQTINTQPALLTVSVAALNAMVESPGGGHKLSDVKFVAGHSVGQYAALVASGALSLPDALRLVRERGRLMQEAGKIQEGSMAAILGLDISDLEQLCQQTGTEIANDNCEGQVVISGSRDALVKAMDLSRALGATKIVQLTVSGAFHHSELMKPALPGMAIAVNNTEFKKPSIPVIGNRTAQPITDPRAFPGELIGGIRSRVRWLEGMQYAINNGVNTFYEVGSGNVLSGLLKRISSDVKTVSIGNIAAVRNFAAA